MTVRTRGATWTAVAATALTSALVLLPAPAQAAPPWVAVTLGETSSAFPQISDVATAPDGRTAVVMNRSDGTNNRINVLLRAPGSATFDAPVAVSAPGANASNSSIGVDPQGNVTVVWTQDGLVGTAYRPAGGSFGPPQLFDTQPLSLDYGPPDLAVGANGGAVVGWTTGTDAVERIAVAVRPPGSGATFPAGTLVSPDGGATPPPNQLYLGPQVAIDDAGDVAALWQRRYDIGSSQVRLVVETAVRPSGAAFAESEARTPTGAGNAATVKPALAMTSTGRVVAAWGYNPEAAAPNNVAQIQYSERIPGTGFTGSWSSRLRISTPGVASSAPRAAVDEQGGISVVWTADNVVQSAVRPTFGTAFSAPHALSGPGADPSSAALAGNAAGEALVTWRASGGGLNQFYSARRRPGTDAFGDVTEVVRSTTVSGATPANPSVSYGGGAGLALDDQGNGVLGVYRSSYDGATNNYTPEALVFDAVAPVLGAVSVPGTVTVGTPIAVSASATDRLSSPALQWSFGDGGTATGAAPSHTYATPGSYPVTVTATDPGGNVTTTTRTVKAVLSVAAKAKLKSTSLVSGRTKVTSLKVTALQPGDTVSLSCSPKAGGCTRSAKAKVTAKASSVSLTKQVKGLSLAPKAKLVVTVSRAGVPSRTLTFTMQKGKKPKLVVS